MKRRLYKHAFDKKIVEEKVENYSITIIDHIIYLLIFRVNDSDLKYWAKEILNPLWLFHRYKLTLPKVKKFSKDKFYDLIVNAWIKNIDEFSDRINEALIEKGGTCILKVAVDNEDEISRLYEETLDFVKYLCELVSDKKKSIEREEIINYYIERENEVYEWLN